MNMSSFKDCIILFYSVEEYFELKAQSSMHIINPLAYYFL